MQGLQAGIFEGDCSGAHILDCDASISNSPINLSGYINDCNTYYFWIDGVNNDNCDFTLTISAGSGGGSLPRPMPKPRVLGSACVCGDVDIEFPGYSGDCLGNVTWKANGIPIGAPGDERVTINFPDERPIEVCVKAVLGSLTTTCDEDSTCILVRPDPIPQLLGKKRNICFEDQPFTWNGIQINQSCISPPCSSRFTLPNGCCVDSLVPFQLKPLYPLLTTDVLVCGTPPDITPFRSEDGRAWSNDACSEQIDFSHPISGCDTSYYLNLRYFQYTKGDLSFCPPCSGDRAICPDVRYTPDCIEFDNQETRILLEWFSSPDSVIIDSLNGSECFVPDSLGKYCYNMFVIFRTDTCFIEQVCFDYDTSELAVPEIYKFKCDSNEIIFTLSEADDLCSVSWNIDTGRFITKGLYDDTLIVSFSKDVPDSVLITLFLESDCFIDTISRSFDLVQELSKDTLVICTSEFPYDWNGRTIDSSGEYRKRLLVNGCVVDSIRFFEESMDEIISIIDTTLCYYGSDTVFYQDPNGKIWRENVIDQFIDVGGNDRCDSLIQLTLQYNEVTDVTMVDTIICGIAGDDLEYVDPYGNIYKESQDSILILNNQGQCDNAVLLNLKMVWLDVDWKEDCSCAYECVRIDPNLSISDSTMEVDYFWLNSAGDTVSKNEEILFACEDDVHCLHVSLVSGSSSCAQPLVFCEPINESVLVPETKVNLLHRNSKSHTYEYELEHNGIRTCEIEWFTTFESKLTLLNPQKTKVRAEAVGQPVGQQQICCVHQFLCGGLDTLCQTLHFKEGEISSPRW